MQKATVFNAKQFLPVLTLICFQVLIIFPSCEKSTEPLATEEASRNGEVGHQAATSPTITGRPSLLNPSNIPSGNPNFIVGTTAGTRWWGTGGLSTDTWSGPSAASTNGKDPCVALGAGWRLPTAADWQNLKSHEDLEGAMTAFMSNLRLPAGGFRDAYGGFIFNNCESNYWSSTASNIYATGLTISDNTYSATLQASERGQGYNCRCVKD